MKLKTTILKAITIILTVLVLVDLIGNIYFPEQAFISYEWQTIERVLLPFTIAVWLTCLIALIFKKPVILLTIGPLFLFIALTYCWMNLLSVKGGTKNSLDIKESKNRGYFIKEYTAENQSKEPLIFEEAWLEYGSIDTTKGLFIYRKRKNRCYLIFKIKQIPGKPFMEDTYDSWSMESNYPAEGSVGLRGGHRYEYYPCQGEDLCSVPDSIVLDLFYTYDSTDENYTRIKTPAGKLIFRPKS